MKYNSIKVLRDYTIQPVKVAVNSSYGDIYPGKRNSDGLDIVLKFNKNPSPENDARFVRECEILFDLEPHGGIIKPITHINREFFDGSDKDYYVMEKSESTFEAWLSMPRSDVYANQKETFRQICLALKHAHDKGYTHRDLHFRNVLMNLNPDIVKLIDFGKAYDFNKLQSLSGDDPAWGGLVMPPEVRFGLIDHVDSSAYSKGDVYALGLIWLCIFQKSYAPISNVNGINMVANMFILSKIGAIRPEDYYSQVSKSDKTKLYQEWLSIYETQYDQMFHIYMNDVALANKLTNIARKLMSFNHVNRLSSVDDVLNEINGL